MVAEWVVEEVVSEEDFGGANERAVWGRARTATSAAAVKLQLLFFERGVIVEEDYGCGVKRPLATSATNLTCWRIIQGGPRPVPTTPTLLLSAQSTGFKNTPRQLQKKQLPS